tara:strand:+ start:4324 stop:5349 length:1026 start_codon:yes stop_codon:yes gene_type:complete
MRLGSLGINSTHQNFKRIPLRLNCLAISAGGDMQTASRLNADGNYYNIIFPEDFYVSGDVGPLPTSTDPFIRDLDGKISAHYDIELDVPAGQAIGNAFFAYGLTFPSLRIRLITNFWTPDALRHLRITINNYGVICGSGGWGGTAGRINKDVSGGGGGGGRGLHPVPSGHPKTYGSAGTTYIGAGGKYGVMGGAPQGASGAKGTFASAGAGGAGEDDADEAGVNRNAEAGRAGGSPFWYDFIDGLKHIEQPEVVVKNYVGGQIYGGGGGGGGSTSAGGAGGAGGTFGTSGTAGTEANGGAGGLGGTLVVKVPLSPSVTTGRDFTFINYSTAGTIKGRDAEY